MSQDLPYSSHIPAPWCRSKIPGQCSIAKRLRWLSFSPESTLIVGRHSFRCSELRMLGSHYWYPIWVFGRCSMLGKVTKKNRGHCPTPALSSREKCVSSRNRISSFCPRGETGHRKRIHEFSTEKKETTFKKVIIYLREQEESSHPLLHSSMDPHCQGRVTVTAQSQEINSGLSDEY